MSDKLTFEASEIYNIDKFVMRGGSKTILNFDFEDEFDKPLDITTSTILWTMSEFGQPDYTILAKNGVLSGEHSCNVTIESVDTKELEGKFIHQITIIDYLGNEYIPAQGIIKINRNNNNDL